MKIVAVLGISGVGKSTLVGRAAQQRSLLHLKASDLIKARLSQSSEQLRQGAVLNHQALMLAELADRVSVTDRDIVVFDGHSIIDTPSGLLEIPQSVFEAIKPNAFVFIEEAAEVIAERRAADSGRVRPSRSAGELTQQQALAKTRISVFAQNLGLPLYVLASADVAGLLSILD